MRKTFHILMLVVVSVLTAACEKDLPLYDDPTCRINFYYPTCTSTEMFDSTLTRTPYSFVYAGATVTTDTIWVEVETMGFTSDKDRPVSLEQLDTTACMAVPGKHYVAFDDPSMASYYVIPAGKARATLPIVVLRDASLKDTSVVLKFTFRENEYFHHGYPVFQTRVITITDRLSEPSAWNKQYYYDTSHPSWGTYSFADYFGAYGPVKHQFLIDQNGKAWDDDYITSLMEGDSNYLNYLMQEMQKALAKLNAERQAQGLDVLREADGTEVTIGNSD